MNVKTRGRGYSLVEMVVAITIFAIIATAALTAVLGSEQAKLVATYQDAATQYASGIVEEGRSISWERLVQPAGQNGVPNCNAGDVPADSVTPPTEEGSAITPWDPRTVDPTLRTGGCARAFNVSVPTRTGSDLRLAVTVDVVWRGGAPTSVAGDLAGASMGTKQIRVGVSWTVRSEPASIALAGDRTATIGESLPGWARVGTAGPSTPTGPQAPQAPTVTTRDEDSTTLAVAWTPTNGTSYEVSWGVSTDPTEARKRAATAGACSGGTCTDVLTGLEKYTTYNVWITAVDDNGARALSPLGTGRTATALVDPTITFRLPSDVDQELSWAASAPGTTYEVRYGTDPNNLALGATTTDTSATITGLTPLTVYYYAVTAATVGGPQDGDRRTGPTAQSETSGPLSEQPQPTLGQPAPPPPPGGN